MLHVSVTLSPLRASCRSVGGLGNSSDGGNGGPIAAHPGSQINAPTASNNCIRSFMRRLTRLHHSRETKEAAAVQNRTPLRSPQPHERAVSAANFRLVYHVLDGHTRYSRPAHATPTLRCDFPAAWS